MLRVALVTILAREMRLKYFEVDQCLEMLRVAQVTILAREMRSKVFSSRPSFGDVASAASHDIGARNAMESFFNYIWFQTANNVTSRARRIFLKFVQKMSIFNRIYRANIVTSGPRSTTKACFVKKTFNRISRSNFVICGTRTTQSQRIACFNRIPCTNIVTKASLLAIACKARLSVHCDGIQGKGSSTSCGWVYSQSREELFSLAGFYFYAIEFTRTAMNRHFRSQVRLSCNGKLTRNRANSNFHPQPAIVILAPIWSFLSAWWAAKRGYFVRPSRSYFSLDSR